MGFVFGSKSSDGFGLAVKTIKAPVLAAPRYEEVEIPGRDGAYKFFQGFKATEAILELTVVGELSTRQAKIKQIKDWLKGTANLKIDYCEAFEATVMSLDSSDFGNATEIIRVTFKSGNSEGSSVPGGGTGVVYDDTEIRGLIAGKVDKIEGKGLSEANYTQAEKDKLAGLTSGGGYDDTALSSRVTTIESNQTAHITNQDIHVSVAEKTQWNAKVDTSALAEYRLKADKIAETDLATEVQTKLNTQTTHTTLKNFYVELDTGKPQPTFEDGFGQEHLRSILLLDGDGVLTLYGEVPDFNLKKIGGPDRICVLHFTFNQWLVLDGTANFIFLSSGQQYKPQTGDTLIFRMKNGVAYEIARFNSQKNLVQSDNVKEIKIENGKLMIYDGQAWHENQGGGGVGRLDSVGLTVMENTYEEGIISGI